MPVSTDNLTVLLLTGGHRVMDRQWCGQTLHEPYARLYAMLQGEATIEHHRQTFRMRRNQLYLIPPNANMRYRCENTFEIMWVHFRVVLDGLTDLFDVCDCRYEPVMSEARSVRETMRIMLGALRAADVGASLRAKGALLQILAPFLSERTEPKPGDTAAAQRLRPILDYIETHLAEPLRVADLARRSGYETNYFSTCFRRAFGLSPLGYVHQQRMVRARLRLLQTDDTLESVAADLGYCDAFHFSKTFKRLTGRSPAAFRAVGQAARP